jgi:cellobiose epimerase
VQGPWHNRAMTMPSISLTDLRQKVEADLTGNILPFWARRGFKPSGNLVGIITHDLRSYDDVPRHAVLCARVLWTFAEAQKLVPNPKWLEAGRKALHLITGPFWDDENGGVYWNLNPDLSPLSDRKQVYAQAFTIYGLVSWYEATGETAALDRAKALFESLEGHARDRERGGYTEALSRTWGRLEDMRLSLRDLNSPKSYNTLLHVLEAYTVLARVWPDARVQEALKTLLQVCLDRIVYEKPFPHCELFFTEDWKSLVSKVSYGHDIEASWLFWEAAVVVNDATLLERTKKVALDLADEVLSQGAE